MTYDEAKKLVLDNVVPHVCRCGRVEVIPEHQCWSCPCGEVLLVLISTPLVAKTKKLSQTWTEDADQELEVYTDEDDDLR